MYYAGNFTVKKTKKGFKITFLNGFNDYVYCKNETELNKLYRISNEYNISRSKKDIIDYMNGIVNFGYYDK